MPASIAERPPAAPAFVMIFPGDVLSRGCEPIASIQWRGVKNNPGRAGVPGMDSEVVA